MPPTPTLPGNHRAAKEWKYKLCFREGACGGWVYESMSLSIYLSIYLSFYLSICVIFCVIPKFTIPSFQIKLIEPFFWIISDMNCLCQRYLAAIPSIGRPPVPGHGNSEHGTGARGLSTAVQGWLVVGGSIHICWFSINKIGWGSYLINQHFSRMGWTSCRNKRVSFPGPVSPRSLWSFPWDDWKGWMGQTHSHTHTYI